MSDKVEFGTPMSDRTLNYKRNCLIISSIIIGEKFLPNISISTLKFMSIEPGQSIYFVLLIVLSYFFLMYFLQGYPEACEWMSNNNLKKIKTLEEDWEKNVEDDHNKDLHMNLKEIDARNNLVRMNYKFERSAIRTLWFKSLIAEGFLPTVAAWYTLYILIGKLL